MFRAGATYVTVDAYPRRDGEVVEGLTVGHFQVFEDGKPPKPSRTSSSSKQQPFAVDAERRDPNTKEEGDRPMSPSRWCDDDEAQ